MLPKEKRKKEKEMKDKKENLPQGKRKMNGEDMNSL